MEDERLVVALEARIRDFERNMAKAERTGTQTYRGLQNRSQSATRAMERDMVRSTGRINQALASTTTQIGAMGKAFAAGAVAAGFAAISAGATRAVASVAELGNEARRAGVNVEAFQEWKYVAEQNRIGIDAMVDGLKELNLRADEFIVTGKGPAAEAFKRLNYGASDLRRALEDPSELLLEIIGRMENLDNAAQIRVADEVFGGTAGERFVELLSQGEDGLRQTIRQARETGAVLDEELIQKADELDRKWKALTQSAGNFFKRVAVGTADAVSGMAGVADEVENIAQHFQDLKEAQNLLGETQTAFLGEGEADLHRDELARLREEYAALGRRSEMTAHQMEEASARARTYGYADVANQLIEAAKEMRALAQAVEDGEIKAEDLEARMADVTQAASETFLQMDQADRVDFTTAINSVGGLTSALGTAVEMARTLRREMPGSTPGGEPGKQYGGRGGDPRQYSGSAEDWQRRNWPEEGATSPRPESRPVDIDFGYNPPEPDVPEAPRSGGGGGGGGRAEISDYQREVERTRRSIAELEAEAVQLVAVAEGGREYGDALEYARKRAELLYEAQAAGKTITPELQAEIDNLALSYTEAGRQAEDAADRLRLIEENAERGADAMSDLFLGIMTGSMSAKDALAGLLAELGRMQVQKAFLGLSDAGGPFGFIGGLLSGNRATGGPARGGGAYMVNERTANSEVFVPSQSGGVLNVPQAQAALRGQTAAGSQGKPQKVQLVGGNLELTDGGKIVATIRAEIIEGDRRVMNTVPQTALKTLRATGNQGVTKRIMR